MTVLDYSQLNEDIMTAQTGGARECCWGKDGFLSWTYCLLNSTTGDGDKHYYQLFHCLFQSFMSAVSLIKTRPMDKDLEPWL